MADIASLLDDVKDYISITWQDEKTDRKITGYIARGMKRLQDIAGASLDFTAEDLPRALLLDYCRYANSQALEVFERNFQAELLELNLRTQAPIVDNLTVLLTKISDSAVSVKISPAPDGGGYVYRVGSDLTLPARLDVCLPGDVWKVWDGRSIPATSGQEVLIVEVNRDYEAERAGKATV